MSDLIVGLMSGTSLDGVDAVLVEFSDRAPEVVDTTYLPYPMDVREQTLLLHFAGHNELDQAQLLSNKLAKIYAKATNELLEKAGVPASQVKAIGCHGQTIRHVPERGYTVQLNNPALLAELTGITVVADFRSRDIAAGGQGAPLVPAFHSSLFRDAERQRLILNVGGITNLTTLHPGLPTFGFDCGPGNMLMDAWTQRHLGASYDDGGRWAASGKVLSELLARLLKDSFFALPPPKSCGREQFNLNWLSGFLAGHEDVADVQATLLALTVTSVQQAVLGWCGTVEELYVCGGGAHNFAMIDQLSTTLPQVRVQTTEALGLPADWVEAMAFAWLAQRTLTGLPGNLPEVTGASGSRVLGAIYPA